MDPTQGDRLARLIQGIDITSVNGRAGLKTRLREIGIVEPRVLESVPLSGNWRGAA